MKPSQTTYLLIHTEYSTLFFYIFLKIFFFLKSFNLYCECYSKLQKTDEDCILSAS